MSDLVSAARRLRDSVAALPEGERTERWPAIQNDSYPPISFDPYTATLLADLFDALSRIGLPGAVMGSEFPTIVTAADALASAILHTDQPEG